MASLIESIDLAITCRFELHAIVVIWGDPAVDIVLSVGGLPRLVLIVILTCLETAAGFLMVGGSCVTNLVAANDISD